MSDIKNRPFTHVTLPGDVPIVPGIQGEVWVDITSIGPAVQGHRVDPLTGEDTRGHLVGQSPGWTAAGLVGVYGYSNRAVGILGISDAMDGIQGRSGSPQHCGVAAVNDVGIALYGRGNPAGRFDGNLVVNGSATVNGNLTIGNGGDVMLADCAEEFEYRGMAETAVPGNVMVLDESGVIQPCSKAYDGRAVGVVSGAGPFRPAIVLDRVDGATNRAPIALMGKVCCNVDASYAPIQVGDMLTTSPTSGHAMKATDPQAAFGAVIGKAIESLNEGRGQIRVLVMQK
ncbi:hypothetical protein [Piscinibacter terrae]|uniref:Uncharacterized protein n=1 Tax=Piscinibacter terrae TaxID=2496871 RepID=A0A3N7HR54_9BURK|nr:hypothetical protein [Albitalea terrae]RQP24720.1 hypothetical protein DZC73_07445 [Albitalea terrae]